MIILFFRKQSVSHIIFLVYKWRSWIKDRGTDLIEVKSVWCEFNYLILDTYLCDTRCSWAEHDAAYITAPAHRIIKCLLFILNFWPEEVVT